MSCPLFHGLEGETVHQSWLLKAPQKPSEVISVTGPPAAELESTGSFVGALLFAA